MIAVRLPKELEEELNRLSKKHNLTKTDIVKEALKIFFQAEKNKAQKTPYELGEALFGKYASGQENLSVTYKERLKGKLREKYNTRR